MRRIIWVLAALLSLGSLNAVPPSRQEAFAEIRFCAALRLEKRAVQRPPATEATGHARIAIMREAPLVGAFDTSFEETRPRFQLPPPLTV